MSSPDPLPSAGDDVAVVPDARHAPAELLARVSRDFLRAHHLLPQITEGRPPWIIATVDSDPCACHNLATTWGERPEIHVCDNPALVAAAIDAAYERNAVSGEPHMVSRAEDAARTAGFSESLDTLLQRAERDLLATAGKAPVVQFVDALLFDAVRLGASDLHLQPLADHIIIRHRIDGVLDEGRRLPLPLLTPMVSRVKVMAGMDVAEHLIPQDGRTTVRIGERSCDVRVSTLPTPHGERVVLRLLDSSKQLQSFPDLGMPPAIADHYLTAARRSAGIILVTGPTGSGKTTTLYATLRELNSRERNIMTIEDPIEYELDGLGLPISQCQVNARKGVTFANGLRHLLRQDPDVILVGEIRDAETARVAIQASLTGHLVFSTLHTNDAPSAVTRLMDLGVEPYLVAASLSVVIAQRLVRTTCSACQSRVPDCAACLLCHGTGYKGRQGLFEFLPIDEQMRSLIGAGASLQELRLQAERLGMHTLRQAGDELIASGGSTREEVERVIHG